MNENALIKTLQGHTDGVLSLAFSPCGKFLATGSEDNTVKLWSMPDGTEMRTVQAHKGNVQCVAFSPDGKVLSSASWDKTIMLWQPPDCSKLAEASAHEGPVNCLAFSPDGKLLLSGSDDSSIKFFSSPGASLKDTLKPDLGDIKALAVSAAGLVAAGGTALKFFDLSGKVLKTNDAYTYGIKHLAFSRDGLLLAASTGMEKRLELWNTQTFAKVLSVKDSDWLNCAAFTQDGKHVITGGSEVKTWDAATGACVKTYAGHTDEIYSVAVSPDGKYLASASNDGTVKLWGI